MRLCAILTLAALAAIASSVHATTHRIDVGGSGDFTTIMGGALAASEGDTILVAPGTYTGPDNKNIGAFGTNLVFLADDSVRAPVIIDCQGQDPAFYFHDGEDATTLVHGFTIRNGQSVSGGGGIRIFSASPTIRNCTFEACRDSQKGGAIYLYDSASGVLDCIFRNNGAGSRGGAIFSNDSSTLITRCLFDSNMVDPGGTGGAAIYCQGGSESITLCTIVENGLDQIYVASDVSVAISHCIIAFGTEGVAVAASITNNAMVTRCLLFANAGGDAPECDEVECLYNSDPLFCDDEADDFTLCDNSVAVWNNNMWLEQIGAFGSGCPECESPVEAATWGAVKALFR